MNKRVLILVNDLLPGGAQKIAADIATRIKGHEPIVAYFNDSSHSEVAIRLTEQGIRVVQLSTGGVWAKCRALMKLLQAEQISVMQTFLPYAGILGRIAGVCTGVPVISAQCNLPHTYPWRVRILDALTLPLARAWVGNTSGIEAAYGGDSALFSEGYWQSGRRHYTLYAGVDVDAIREHVRGVNRPQLRASLGIPKDASILMMTARLISWKGHRTLIRAMKYLPDAHVLLVGWGPLETELKTLAETERVIERVHFLGRRDDVLDLLSIADGYVQTHEEGANGVWEGPNLSQMEACAAGVPSVSSAVPRIEELIEDGVTGRVARLNDSEDVARVIDEVLHDPSARERMASVALERVRERFSVEVMVDTYAALYERVGK